MVYTNENDYFLIRDQKTFAFSVEAPISAFFGCAYNENFEDREGRYPVLNSSMFLVAMIMT